MQQDNSQVRLLSNRELILTLQGICRENRSGLLIINTDEGGTAKLTIEQGLILDVSFRGVSGKSAVLLIKKINKGKVSFFSHSQASALAKIDLTTPEILQLLEASVEKTEIQTASVSQESTAFQDNKAFVQPQFSFEQQMVVIEAHLAAIIGPVARIIYHDFKQEVQQSNDLDSLNAVIEKISRQVLNSGQQKLFKHNMRVFIDQYGLKGQKTVLDAFKSSGMELKLNPESLSLCISKYAVQGESAYTLLSKLAQQLEYAGNMAATLGLVDALRFLEKSGKTGLLEIHAGEKKGGFYLEQGILINAVEAQRHGVMVAIELLQLKPDYMVFIPMSQVGVSREIHQNVDVLAKDVEKLSAGIINKQEGLKYAQFDKSAHSGDALQNALAKEIERLQSKTSGKKDVEKQAEAEYLGLITKAVHLAEAFDTHSAEQIITHVLMSHDDNFNAWLWFSRVLTNMSAIEFALKKAGHINPKSSELADDVKKFTTARKVVKTDFVLRCPFCWMPVEAKDLECPHCEASFFIGNTFFSEVGKAKTDMLDKAIERFGNALQRDEVNAANVYLHFYLAMAYLNRKYYQEGLEQLGEIAKLAPENQALINQGKMLTQFMMKEGLVSSRVKQGIEVPESKQKSRILVVEDSMVTRKVISRTLVANGYEVFEAKDANEALTDIGARNPGLVLLDIVLPGRDGYEILAEIRKMPQFTKIPVIMLTSRDSLFDKLKGKVSDANEYLTKPFQPDELLTIVKKYLK